MKALPRFVLLVLVLSPAVPVYGQLLEQPVREARGIFAAPLPVTDPTRTTQHVTLSGSALAGYDDSLMPEGAIQTSSTTEVQGGYTGFADLGLRYWRGRSRRWFSLEGFGYLMSYSNIGIDPQAGGNVRIAAFAPIGQSNSVELRQEVRSDPFLSFGAFGSLRPDIDVGAGPDANPANGLFAQRSWASDTTASANWQLSRRTTMSAGYEYVQREFVDERGFDNRAHIARTSFAHGFSRTGAITGSYQYYDSLSLQARDVEWPFVTHAFEAGANYQKGLSPTRRLEFAGGAGATRLESTSGVTGIQVAAWAPSGYFSARGDIGRTWAVSAAYRRAATLLDGLTPEPFLADSVLVRSGGLVSDRVELLFSAGYSNGAEQSGLVQNGRFETFTLAAQARVALARAWAVVVNYHRNEYRLFGYPPPPLGPDPDYGRGVIRIGMTFWYRPHEPRIERPARTGS
jgi:hypothetical protein